MWWSLSQSGDSQSRQPCGCRYPPRCASRLAYPRQAHLSSCGSSPHLRLQSGIYWPGRPFCVSNLKYFPKIQIGKNGTMTARIANCSLFNKRVSTVWWESSKQTDFVIFWGSLNGSVFWKKYKFLGDFLETTDTSSGSRKKEMRNRKDTRRSSDPRKADK